MGGKDYSLCDWVWLDYLRIVSIDVNGLNVVDAKSEVTGVVVRKMEVWME